MVASGQLELDYNAPEKAAVASVADVERVVGILRARGMLTAAEIVLAQGLPLTENNKRKVRAVARASFPGILSFVGGDGYKLLDQCTLDEIWSADSSLESQARDIAAKRLLLRQVINTREGASRS